MEKECYIKPTDTVLLLLITYLDDITISRAAYNAAFQTISKRRNVELFFIKDKASKSITFFII